MAVNQTLNEAIQAIQLELKNFGMVNEPDNYSKLTGALNWLFSPENPKAIQTEMIRSANASKYRPVEIRYLPKKGTGELVTSDASASCTKADTRREIVQSANATLYVEDKFSIEEEIVREGTLEQLQTRIAKEVRDAQRNCREDMNRQLLAAYASNFGSNPATGTNAGIWDTDNNIQLLLAAGTVDADNFDVIKNHQEDNYMTGTIGLLGLGLARKYMNRLAVGNIADGGFDVKEIASQFGMALFKDHYTTTALGNADRVIASYAGTSAFYNYNIYKGDFNLDFGDNVRPTDRDWEFL